MSSMHRHFTATAFIVDSRKRTLLLRHKRLGRWMPPGGHVAPDETPEDCARRECKEETGLDVEIGSGAPGATGDLFAANPHEGRMLQKPIALLLENIPATPPMNNKRGEPAHQHMDFLYVARPTDEAQATILAEDEAHEMRWFTRAEVAALDPRTEIFANVQAYILQLLVY